MTLHDMNDLTKLKQDFIDELILFSPKYNDLVAGQLAETLSQDELEQYVVRLKRINDKEEEYMEDLEEKNPEEYKEELEKKEQAEEKEDDAFYKTLEEETLKATEDVDNQATEIEVQIDAEEKQAEEKLTEEYDRANDLLGAFFNEEGGEKDDEKSAPKPKVAETQSNQAAPAPVQSVEKATEETPKIPDNITDIRKQLEFEMRAKEHAPDPLEEKKNENWQ